MQNEVSKQTTLNAALEALTARFPDLGIEAKPLCTYLDGRSSGQLYVTIAAAQLMDVCRFLKTDSRCAFNQLSDVTCVDYLNFPTDFSGGERFGVTYNLVSTTLNHRLFIKVFVSDPKPTVPSLCPLYQGAEWTEREVYDLFGVTFSGHPDLRRILMPANFKDHPLRKDYPLRGKGEREAFDVITRESS